MTETSIARGIEDWKRAAIAGSLAQAIYYARAEVHGWHQHWYALGDTLKHHYVDEAVALLAPPTRGEELFDKVVAVARAQAAVIVGRIDPQTPWGRTDEPMEGGK